VNKLLVTFYTFGTKICFLRGEGMDGEEEDLKQK